MNVGYLKTMTISLKSKLPLKVLNEAPATTKTLVQGQKISHSIIIALLQQPLHMKLDLPSQILILKNRPQLVLPPLSDLPGGQRQGMFDGPRPLSLRPLQKLVKIIVVVGNDLIQL